MDLGEIVIALEGNQKVQILRGIEAFTLPLLLRIESKPSLVRQIINQDKVPLFHAATGSLVHSVISKRAEYGIAMKNLLTYADPVKEIEKSNPATLKESRMLPKDVRFDLVMAIFGDYVAVTKLDIDDCVGYIVKDRSFAASFEAMFDLLWQGSTTV